MTKATNPCETCVFAEWDKTKGGKLHPSGWGRCRWTSGDLVLPKSVEYQFQKIALPLRGSWIQRGTKHESQTRPCPTWSKAP